MAKPLKNSTIDASEIAKFEAMAEEWWSETGKFRPLHLFNPVRIRFIRDRIATRFGRKPESAKPLKGLRILDIGCGGGLLCEPLARLGAEVTGIDASEKNIRIAATHAEKSGVEVTYKAIAAETLAKQKKQFDAVLAMEIIEHVADVDAFLEACTKLVKPGGLLFVATLNRTPKSFLFAIVGAEYVMRWLPKGTHEWKKFLRPSEIVLSLEKRKLHTEEVRGVTYHPLRSDFSLTSDTSVNYILLASKNK